VPDSEGGSDGQSPDIAFAHPATDPPSVEELIVETRKTYGGPLEVAEDLMQFEIGEDVKVRRYDLQHAI
jgi:hypothetical protein